MFLLTANKLFILQLFNDILFIILSLYFRITQYICSYDNVHALPADIYEDKYQLMEEIHHSITTSTIFPDRITLHAIILGKKL